MTVGRQQPLTHRLARFGYTRTYGYPWRYRRLYIIVVCAKDIWLIMTGRCSLHRAWQAGYDDHIQDESARRARGGQ